MIEYSQFSPTALLIVLMLADWLMGTLARIGKGTVSSSANWSGVTKKAGTLLIVSVAHAVTILLPLPQMEVLGFKPDVAFVVALFYCGSEFLSLFENASRMGIQIPPVFTVVTGRTDPPKAA